MPNLGIKIPKMGRLTTPFRTKRHGGLADALFSATQLRVLALLFGQPDRSFYATELITLVGAGSGAVQRELARLELSGLVSVRRMGTQKHYQADPGSPLFNEICGIVQKTVGLAEPLRAALAPFTADIVAAFVYGSVAKKQDTAVSDIDLMVISDRVSYSDLFAALEPVAAYLGRAVNPTVYTRKQLAKRRQEDAAFIKRVLSQPKVWLIGSDVALAACALPGGATPLRISARESIHCLPGAAAHAGSRPRSMARTGEVPRNPQSRRVRRRPGY
jgi:predicted nucleotidyltransferase